MRERWWWAFWMVVLLAVAVLGGATPVSAQGQSLYWRRWDVSIDSLNMVENRFRVAEIHDIQFTLGQFRFGFRAIPLDRVDDLTNIRVYEGETPLTASCSERPGTYCVRDEGGERRIVYYFLRPAQNEQRTFTIEYEVVGGLRVYEGGDQIDWNAIAADHSFPVQSSTVTVRMPQGYSADLVAAYGAPATWDVRGDLVIFTTQGQLRGNEGLEVRIQYPHTAEARKAGWQTAFDLQAQVRPWLNLLFGGGSVFLLIFGPLVIFYLWYSRGRDPEIGIVPEYLSALPADLPPALAGTLVDEKVDMQDVMSTLLDLARRGYLVIEEDRQSGLFGIGSSTTFTFKRTDQAYGPELRRYERHMLDKVFRGRNSTTLDSLRNKFYTAIPQIQKQLYDEVVQAGFFRASPESMRNLWRGIGILLLVVAFAGAFLVLMGEVFIAETLVCVPMALGVVGVAMLVASGAMPAKTARGAEEAAKWRAFREYLRNIRSYANVAEATSQFNEYLPYAVAFGMERAWVNTFSRVPSTPIPYWYYPVYLGGPWRHGYRPGATPVDIRDQLARPGFSLDGMAGNVFTGLNQMSDGLFGMLNSAANTFSSRPSSSSGGGGGFSGGFSGGGGGGGGGSAGFG